MDNSKIIELRNGSFEKIILKKSSDPSMIKSFLNNILNYIKNTDNNILLDMKYLNDANPDIIGSIVNIYVYLVNEGRKLLLTNVSKNIIKIFSLSKLDTYLTIFKNIT